MIFIGHKNPDTDAVCAAIGAASLWDGKAARAGEFNKETEFIFNYFKIPIPEIITDFKGEAVGLVDHNEKSQYPEGLETGKLKKVVDHHLINLTTSEPIEIIMRPWGSTSTVIANEFVLAKKAIPEDAAKAMLAGILSDTLALQGPTTTEKDKEMVMILLPLTGIKDYKTFAKEMFMAKSNLGNLSAKEILNLDYKVFELGGKKIGFGVAETVAPEQLLARKIELLEAMGVQKNTEKLDGLFFAIVDVLASHSDLLVLSDAEKMIAEKAFGAMAKDNLLDIEKRVSRKKEMIPAISEAIGK
ncbi:MAG: manganese-dependent inorganic pyrophosphatase [Parcubacteria group bacterium Gr01-1014_18]|nr:MAG: manganese-dependent inorganic pyrophosphatase [Parcubacteria group bacterium Greene0416_36]TSC80736.1 MAG: manganese-dependent inorganic pyrophosphatase [Parcubacteria group bacterium Gr01-1014_18]TSC98653.1 MAG: manganese-dependent inorganic pyrophosphatase [Parcubacteria group bacterium Greene1014_20]TSD07187.1 MAG: manganese-dependent inorganic pyrophosphatase [Parcubacteria group bacterium Greene0714_2]